jgi:tRNA/rRNA methyltransferase
VSVLPDKVDVPKAAAKTDEEPAAVAALLRRCRVVLVRPQTASNLGAIARVMRNLGFEELVLVTPQASPQDPRARLLATHSTDLLEQARSVADLGEALADCGLAVATSARRGGLFRRQSVGTPEQILPHVLQTLTQQPAALVFGPEDHGLRNEEISRCHYLLHIPTHPAHPALNLAQAVAICLYEVRRLALQHREGPPSGPTPAPFADLERMFNHLRQGLEAIHFLYGPKAEALLHALRHLLGRARPTPMEVDILHGLARQLCWIAAQARSGKETS